MSAEERIRAQIAAVERQVARLNYRLRVLRRRLRGVLPQRRPCCTICGQPGHNRLTCPKRRRRGT